jgi:hypothetical protein
MNINTIILNATQFYNAYFVLDANKQHIRNEINKINPYSISPKIYERMKAGELKVTDIPEVVALAFSCELFLKAMLLHYAGIEERREHNHFKLMHMLPPEVFDELLRHLCNAMPEMSEELILNCVFDNAAAFVQWRYFHETGQASHMTNFAATMALVMKDMLELAVGSRPAADLSDGVL